MSVPRILHQTWKTEWIPEAYRAFADSVRTHHPHFQIRLWTDRDNRTLIADRYPWFLPTYDAYAHDIERADAIRYFLLHAFGGVYVDLDMECLRPFDELLEDDAVHLSLEAGPSIFQKVLSNAFMAAPAGHAFFAGLIRELPSIRGKDVTFQDVFRNTGPDMLHAYCQRAGWADRISVVGLDRICPVGVIEQNVALPSRDLAVIRRDRLLYAIHHNTESWNTQYPPPEVAPAGYVLFDGHDIPGHDLEFVQRVGASFELIRRRCDEIPEAVAFNYNGFVKGPGGALEPSGQSRWLKEGIRPWVCVKEDRLGDVR